MRNLYLVRHGKPDFPGGIRRCIGRTQTPLSDRGREQAFWLQEYFREHPVSQVFSSPLGRCQETAEILSGGSIPTAIEPGLMEMDMGEWENIPLGELKKTLESEPQHGEKRAEALVRMRQTIEKIVECTSGDIVCVSHAGIICCYLSYLLGTPLETSRALPQPYGGISRIEISRDGRFRAAEVGRMPDQVPDRETCEEIWEHYHTPENVRRHCRAVCEQAVLLGEQLNEAGCSLNMGRIRGAALLHDVARAEPDHAEKGAGWLVREGYPVIAEIIRCHHDIGTHMQEQLELHMQAGRKPRLTVHTQNGPKPMTTAPVKLEMSDYMETYVDFWLPDEAEVVYLADKMVCGENRVPIEERFARSRQKCSSKSNAWEILKALRAHNRRYAEARYIERRIAETIDSACDYYVKASGE